MRNFIYFFFCSSPCCQTIQPLVMERVQEIDGEQYIIKEVVPQTSSFGRLVMTITRFIVAPFLITTSATLGLGVGKQ